MKTLKPSIERRRNAPVGHKKNQTIWKAQHELKNIKKWVGFHSFQRFTQQQKIDPNGLFLYGAIKPFQCRMA
jgi:hypothetical protein